MGSFLWLDGRRAESRVGGSLGHPGRSGRGLVERENYRIEHSSRLRIRLAVLLKPRIGQLQIPGPGRTGCGD